MKALAILSVSLYIAFGMQNYLVSLKQGLNCFFHSFKVFAATVKVSSHLAIEALYRPIRLSGEHFSYCGAIQARIL